DGRPPYPPCCTASTRAVTCSVRPSRCSSRSPPSEFLPSATTYSTAGSASSSTASATTSTHHREPLAAGARSAATAAASSSGSGFTVGIAHRAYPVPPRTRAWQTAPRDLLTRHGRRSPGRPPQRLGLRPGHARARHGRHTGDDVPAGLPHRGGAGL